jgi:hypothetical protein
MGIQHPPVPHLWRGDDAEFFLEDMMALPPCLVCKEGRLLPTSHEKTAFAFWVCTLPSCAYTISRDTMPLTYYKGTGSSKERDKKTKQYTEVEF